MFVVLVAGAGIWLVVRPPSHRLIVRTHFHNAQGLRPGAHVRVDGVDVGLVKDVRVNTQPGDGAIDLRMVLRTPYALAIPSDAIASLQTEGVLGPTFVEIDTRKASGSALPDNGTLKSVEFNLSREGAAHALEVVGDAILKEAQKIRDQNQPQPPAGARQP